MGKDMKNDREIIVSPAAFHAPKAIYIPHGTSIRGMVDILYPDINTTVIVEIDGEPVPYEKWDIIPDIDSHVLINIPLHGGGGGKNPLRTLLTIVVVVAAIAAGQWYLATYGVLTAAGTYTTASLMGSYLVSAAVMTAGSYLVNAIAPVKLEQIGGKSQKYEDSPTYSISTPTNAERPWMTVPTILGKHRVYPAFGAKAYTEIVGENEYLRILVVWGYGPMQIEDIKLGDTLLSSYKHVRVETREGWSTDTDITLFPSSVNQETVGVLLKNASGPVDRTAQANVDEISVDICFPYGLVQYDNYGHRLFRSVTIRVRYREVGDETWTTLEDKTFTDMSTSAVRYGWNWEVDNTKQYEIRLNRLTPDTDDQQIMDKVYWTNLRSIKTTYPINFPYPLAVTALRIKATDQLNGMISNLNAVVTSYCPVWDSETETWGDEENEYLPTNNPAALIRHVLTGNANAKKRTVSQVDNATLGEFYEFCETNGYAFNMYRDYTSSVFETCQDIASTARSAITLKDGLWSVVSDTGNQTLVQHITPRNSWGFSSKKLLYEHPHAFRIKFKNENNEYEDDERIVYDDGYSEENATLFETIEFPGITNPDLIWKFGRYHIAQARLRPEMYSLYMDFEHLVCRRGDKVRVSHDVPLWGSGSGRVKSFTIQSGNITHIILDELIIMEEGKSYACRFRLSDGSSLVLSIVTDPGETDILELQTPVAEESGPKVGDLAMFGEANRETVELLVHSIRRSGDFTAQLFLVDVAPDIYNADTGEIPAFDPQTTPSIDITELPPKPPTIEGTASGKDASTISGGGSVSSLIVYLSAPDNDMRIRGYRVRYRVTGESQWQYTPEMENLTITITPVIEDVEYEIQAQSISVYGVASTWTSIGTGTPATPQLVPAHPTDIAAELVAGGEAYNYCAVHITFTPPPDPVFSHCEVYASNDDIAYHYVGTNSSGSFIFSGLGSVYEAGDTCYIKLRSISIYELAEPAPATYDASVLIEGYIRLGGFYVGEYSFRDNVNADDAKILIDKTNTLIRLGDKTTPYLVLDGDYSGVPAVKSSDYVSGSFGSGFLLKHDLLEVGNIASRGIIRTAVFQKDVVSAVGGNLAVLPADLLNANMSANDSDDGLERLTEAGDTRITEAGDTRILDGYAFLTIEGNETFSVGDILRIKDGAHDEWIRVENTDNAPTYVVTRDLAGNYADGFNPQWPKGASVVNYGQAGDGGIFLTASDTNAPHLSIFTHDGEPWNSITTHIREGNLNGYAGYETDVYGWASYIDVNNYIKVDPVNGIRMSGEIIITGGSGVLNLNDTGALATKNYVGEGDLQSTVLNRMFLNAEVRENIEAWRKAGSPTYIDGEKIYAKTITADKFVSTLYGDINQAMAYVKTVLGAGDEFEYDLTDTDLSNGSATNIDADTHADYGVSIRIATAQEWDDGGEWDTGTWDEPTKSSGSWISSSINFGASRTLQLALRYTKVEENVSSTTETIKFQYSIDGINFGTNAPSFDDGLWETASINRITGNIYKASGNLFTFAHFKVKVELETTSTIDRIILHTMTCLGNVTNLFGMKCNKAIASEGTTIDLKGFNSTPAITVTPIGSTPLVPLITAQSSSSVTIKLYNLSGNAVSGNANITMIGI